MNERIKELIEQAGAIPIHGKPKDRALVGYDNIEKFALLCVKECIDAIGNDPMAQPYIQRIKTKFGAEYYEPIEKAFGVEE